MTFSSKYTPRIASILKPKSPTKFCYFSINMRLNSFFEHYHQIWDLCIQLGIFAFNTFIGCLVRVLRSLNCKDGNSLVMWITLPKNFDRTPCIWSLTYWCEVCIVELQIAGIWPLHFDMFFCYVFFNVREIKLW